jgi:uncharacterized repeat protein (TIGR01451 family)
MIRDILPTNMEYVKDSTYLYNSNHKDGVKINENTLTTTGINIGSYNSRGNAYVRFTAKVVKKDLACGSNQLVNWANATVGSKVVKDDASVMVEVTCQPTPTPETKSSIAKTVRIKGSNKDFVESVSAKIGDEVEFQIVYKNLSEKKVDNVTIADVLPKNLEYVKDSTYLYNAKNTKGVKVSENTLTTTGINVGSYNSNETATIRFTAKVVNSSLSCGDNKLVNQASATVDKKVVKDDASVTVKRDCTPAPDPTPEPEPEPEPTVIVNTGPTEVVASAIGAGGLITAAGYFISSRKKIM